MVLFISSCSSDDEPESEYTGPWQIEYMEIYCGWNTQDPNFKNWFDAHLQDFEYAEFQNSSGLKRATYSKENGDYIEWQDYKTWYQGGIVWYEIIENATESEIQDMVAEFESFSSYKDENHKYLKDEFTSQYIRLDQ